MSSKKYAVSSMFGFGILLFLLLTSYFLLPISTPVHAQEIDLLWQGNTYTPPFYEGRSLWSQQSNVTIVAIPHIPGISNTSSLEYKWTKDSVVLGSISGIGKNSLSFSDSIFGKPVNVKIEVLASDGALLASQSVNLAPQGPKVLIYENNPLYGFMFNKEAGDEYVIKGSEVTFAVFPLFFSALSRNSGVMNYLWTTNSGSSESSNAVTYRVPEGVSGSSRINVRASNIDKARQSISEGFSVRFDNQNNGL